MQAKIAVSVAGVLVVGALAACSPGGAGRDQTADPDVDLGAPVAVGLAADWQTMDHQVNPANLMWWQTGGYDRLTAVYDGEVVPYLAESWEVADDNTSATFTLRKDAVCQDGTPVTPQVVADSFQRLFTEPKKGINMTHTFGAGPWSVSADEAEGTVTISTETPFRALVQGVASGEASIVCPAGLANPEALQTGFFGSGPYTLESAVHGSAVVLKKNPDWTWGPVVDGKQVTAADLPDEQTWKIIQDPTTTANSFETGSLHVGRLSGPDVKRFVDDDRFSVERVRLNFPLAMSFQQRPGHATSDPALRRALSTAIDPESFAQAYVTDGSPFELATSFVDRGHECYDPRTEQLYPSGGIEGAKQILADAGYTGVGSELTTPDGTPVTLRIVTSPNYAGQTGPYLLQAFEPLGADIDLSNVDGTVAQQLTYSGQQEVGVSSGTASFDDPAGSIISYYAGTPITEGGLNTFGPPPSLDPEWNALISEALASAQCDPWIDAQEHALTESILLPVATAFWTRITTPDIEATRGFYFYEPWTIRNAMPASD